MELGRHDQGSLMGNICFFSQNEPLRKMFYLLSLIISPSSGFCWGGEKPKVWSSQVTGNSEHLVSRNTLLKFKPSNSRICTGSYENF